jgi:hypothetical protein
MSTNWLQVFAGACPTTSRDDLIVPCFLSPDVALGQFGWIDSDWNFHFVDVIETLPAYAPSTTPIPPMSFHSGATQQTDGNVTVKGKVIDPENGLTVEANTQATWQFTESTSLAGELAAVYHNSINQEQALTDPGNQEQITLAASKYGYTNQDGTLKPNWVVITDVYQIISGVIVGSTSKNSSFAISGTAAIEGIIDGSVDAGWGLKSDDVSNQFFFVPFPGSPIALKPDGSGVDPSTVSNASTLYTIAFTAASIHVNQIVPWKR